MRHILSNASISILKTLSQERTLCAFDFDGTLSPIVEYPDGADMRVRTRNLLRRLASLYPCIIVSGRSRADALSKLRGVKVARVIGNHGAEADAALQSQRRMEQSRAALERELGAIPGVWVEDKSLSLAIHYRQAAQKAEARRLILEAAGKLKHVRVFGGKQVVNVTPESAPDKGDALAAERDRLGCNWVLYVGDDENDEEAFALGGNVVPVRIGRKQRSHARYYLCSQAEIDELLERLVRLREPQ
jgi:trehalose 6-phosphate phosphatase